MVMETLFVHLIKSSGLIAMFYLAYFVLLRKETFFNSNRWFLLAGLITSVILPFVFITKIIWVEPTTTPTLINWSYLPVTNYTEEETLEDYLPMLMAVVYGMGILILLAKFAFDFYSLRMILKTKYIEQQADLKFIDTKENIAPFSYFNIIVYNSSLYNTSELENILEHEKVHSSQNHTVDVLVSRLFCVVFWFNPFIWLYKKAILQNLEFIADKEASKRISDKKAYQITLLKITTQENCVAITNHFYQSLIKKRIVMLNKNQSKKRNLWKYAFVLPVLVAFVFLFQMKVIAKERENQTVSKTVLDVVTTINKNFSDEDLKKKAEFFKKEFNCDLVFSEIERNSKNEIIGITVNYSVNEYGNGTYKQHSSNAIKDIYIKHDGSGKIDITDAEIDAKIALSEAQELAVEKEIFINGEKVSQNDLDKLDPNEIATMNVNKNNDKQEIRIITNKHAKMANENDIYINGQKVSQNELDVLDQSTIERMDVNKHEKTIRIVTINGMQHSQDRNLPVPPTPPVFNMKTPAPPAFPKAPKVPKGNPIHGDKKAWEEFEKKMEDYESKMKKLEPQMEAFDKQMADFDKQMQPFQKEMKVFEEKMKVYEKEMEKYLLEKKKDKN
jgi:hypothetical protein